MAQVEDHRADEVTFPPYRYLSVTVRVLEGLVVLQSQVSYCISSVNGSVLVYVTNNMLLKPKLLPCK